MNVIFPVMGAENISVAYISSALKAAGHKTKVAFDRALFDDKQYFTIPFLARLLSDKDRMIRAIIDEKPDVLAFSVFNDNYQWCLDVARRVREEHNCITVWGGYHPTSCPDDVILEDVVDYVIVGEGEGPVVELLRAIETQGSVEKIPNLYLKKNGTVVRNPARKLMEPDDFPEVDKTIFEKFVPIQEYYLTVSSKGCIQKCSFCMQNFLASWEKENNLGRFLREKSVDAVLAEFKTMKERYGIKYIDIKNNVLSGNKKWLNEFCERYPKEVGLPFRIMGHVLLLQGDLAQKLKAAGCHHMQIGIESMNPEVRNKVLLRDESNEEIIRALKNIDAAGINFSADLIVGLPGEKEEDLELALEVFSRHKHLIRASIFWLQYMPAVDITKNALQAGLINKNDEQMIIKGFQDNYLSTGSPMEASRKRILKTYHILFRLVPILPGSVMRWLVRSKVHHVMRYLPFQIAAIVGIDVFVSYLRKDYYAKWIMKWYLRHFMNRVFGRAAVISD